MNIEKILYTPFGNNIIIGSHIKDQLNFLKKILPEDFKKREMYDLGCGDGKVTILLKEIFEAKKVFGCDRVEILVKRAKKRGIEAEVIDLEKKVPEGELGVVWRVLHHLKEPADVLKEMKENFQFLFLNEPIKKSLFELGRPFERQEIENMFKKTLKGYQSFEYKGSCFIFWRK